MTRALLATAVLGLVLGLAAILALAQGASTATATPSTIKLAVLDVYPTGRCGAAVRFVSTPLGPGDTCVRANRTTSVYFNCSDSTLTVYRHAALPAGQPGVCSTADNATTTTLVSREAQLGCRALTTPSGQAFAAGYTCRSVPRNQVIKYAPRNVNCSRPDVASLGDVYLVTNVCHRPLLDSTGEYKFSGMVTASGDTITHSWWNNSRACFGTPTRTRTVTLSNLAGCVDEPASDASVPDASGVSQTAASTSYTALATLAPTAPTVESAAPSAPRAAGSALAALAVAGIALLAF